MTANLDERDRYKLFQAVDTQNRFDLLLIDTGAGINSNAVSFAATAQTVMVADPDPTSLADAYAFIKVMAMECGTKGQLIANRVAGAREGEEVYDRLSTLQIDFWGLG